MRDVGGSELLHVDVEEDAGCGSEGTAAMDAGLVEQAGDVCEAAEHWGSGGEGGRQVAPLRGAEQGADGAETGVCRFLEHEVRHDGGESFAVAQGGRGFELGGVEGALDEEGAQALDEVLAGRAGDLGGAGADVVMKVAAELVVFVAEGGGEEEA